MKLLIVGSDEIYSIENFYVKYLREAGVEVSCYTSQKYFYQYYQKNFLNKIVYRTGFSDILKKINRNLIALMTSYQPDIAWIFKGMEVFPATLAWAQEHGIKLVNFNGDSPFIFSGRGSGNKNVTDSIPLYDLHLTYNRAVKAEMNIRNLPVELLPFGFDLDVALYEKCCTEDEFLKLCFLGNPDEQRAEFIKKLAIAGIAVDLYGNDWDKFVHHKNIQAFPPVYGDEQWRVLRRYRIQLNLMRPHNPDTHNMRTFELGSIGAIQLAPDTPDHREYFVPGKEIFLFRDLSECIQQVAYLLNITGLEADCIRLNTRARSLKSGYDYRSRSKQVLIELNKLLQTTIRNQPGSEPK